MVQGTKKVRMRVGRRVLTCDFNVVDIRRPLLSVSALTRHGFYASFGGKNESLIGRGRGLRLPLVKEGNHFFLAVDVLPHNMSAKVDLIGMVAEETIRW
eukprot:3893227-Heterocapsa_arctica.AAC.1